MSYLFGDFELDTEKFSLSLRGKETQVQRLVFDLIKYLVEHNGQVVSRESLLRDVWKGVVVGEASVAQAIMLARRALHDELVGSSLIETIRGRGYRFSAEIRLAPTHETVTRKDNQTPTALQHDNQHTTLLSRAKTETLVGRDQALGVINHLLENTGSAQGGCGIFLGAMGTGKTKLLEIARTNATTMGHEVVFSRCSAPEGWLPALWPWADLLRQLLQRRDESVRAKVLSMFQGVAPLLPEKTSALYGFMTDESGAAKFRLFTDTWRLIEQLSKERPLVLLIDDLHEADSSSLELLHLIATALPSSKVTIMVGVRPPTGQANTHISEIIARLTRLPHVQVSQLETFSLQQVFSYFESQGVKLTNSLGQAIYECSGGNPLLVNQIAGLMPQRSEELSSAASISEALLRTGAQALIHSQLKSLRDETKAVLQTASVFGRSFTLSNVFAMNVAPSDSILVHLDLAEREGIVQSSEDAMGYVFCNRLVRDALYQQLPRVKRMTLHAAAGSALAKLRETGGRTTLSEIAYHLCQAAPLSGADQACSFAVKAAEEAVTRHGYDEAAQLYEAAIETLDLGAPDPARRVELLLALGTVRFRAGEVAVAKQLFERGGSLARTMGSSDHLAKAALGYALEEESSLLDAKRIAFLQEGLSSLAGSSKSQRALLTGRLAVARYFTCDLQETIRLARTAVDMARKEPDPATLAYALRCLHYTLLAPSTISERVAIVDELLVLAKATGDKEAELRGLLARIMDSLQEGELHKVDADISRYSVLAEELSQPQYTARTAYLRAMRSLTQGRLNQAIALFEELPTGAQNGVTTGAFSLLFALRREQGRLRELEDTLRESIGRAPERSFRRAALCFCLVSSEKTDEAIRILKEMCAGGLAQVPADLEWLGTVACLAEVAVKTKCLEEAKALREALRPFYDQQGVLGMASATTGPLSRHLGLLEFFLGEYDPAIALFEHAVLRSSQTNQKLFELHARTDLFHALRKRNQREDLKRAATLEQEVRRSCTDLGLIALTRSE